MKEGAELLTGNIIEGVYFPNYLHKVDIMSELSKGKLGPVVSIIKLRTL